MRSKNNNAFFIILALFFTVVFVLPFMMSCSKSGVVNGATSNTQLEVINVSPDVGPIDIYAGVNYVKQNTSSFIFNNPGSYFFISPSDTVFQIRTTQEPSITILSLDKLNLLSNIKYTLFVTGLASSNSISDVFTVDDTVKPQSITEGYGELRFVNTSILSPYTSLDVTANGTVAFSGIKYKQISPYIQLPAGNYNFQIYPTGYPTLVFSTPSTQSVTIQDGGLYTLYSYGIVGQIDTAAVNAAIITNR
jgi:hypothetical protein